MDQEHSLPGRTIRLRYQPAMTVLKAGAGLFGYFFLIGLLLAAAQYAFGWTLTVSLPTLLAVGAAIAVLHGVISWWRVWRIEFCMNDERVWMERRGVTRWSIDWDDLIVKGGGFLGDRIYIRLPDGKWQLASVSPFVPGRDSSEFMATIRQRLPLAERETGLRSGRSALICLVVAVSGLYFMPSLRVDNPAAYEQLQASGGAWSAGLNAVLIQKLLAGLGVIALMLAMMLGALYCEAKRKQSGRKPEKVLTELEQFRKAAFGYPLPVELELNVQYRYVSREELAAEIKQMSQVTWIMSLVLVLVILPLAFFESWVFVLSAFGVVGVLILLLHISFRSMIAMRQSLGDTIVRTESGLTIIRDGVSHRFSAEPPRKTRLKPGHDGAAIGTWWEEYSDEGVRYRVDRKYLVPVDDDQG